MMLKSDALKEAVRAAKKHGIVELVEGKGCFLVATVSWVGNRASIKWRDGGATRSEVQSSKNKDKDKDVEPF